MGDDAERDRLVQRVYARSSADEPEQDFTDPDSGERVRMRPSAWELLLYDRRVAAGRTAEMPVAASPSAADGPTPARDAAGSGRSTVGDVGSDPDSDADVPDPPPESAAGIRPHGRRMLAAGLVAGTLIGALGVAIVEAASTSFFSPSDGEPAGTPVVASEAMLHAVFNSPAYPPADPGDSVRPGFFPGTFRTLAGDVLTDDDVRIYAAIRTDGAYCLVAAVDGTLATSQCGTAAEIAERGLRMEKAARSPSRGELIAVTVEWETDGLITWHVDPWPGLETPTPAATPSPVVTPAVG